MVFLEVPYSNIYKIYFVMPEKRSLLHKIVTFNSKSISNKEKDEAKKYFNLLKKSSEDLIALLENFEQETRNSTAFSDMNHL